MKNNSIIRHTLLSIPLVTCLLWASMPVGAQQSLFLRDYPSVYVVQNGDTLWNIASQFLQDPLRWPDVWQPDPFLDEPEAIYPGDTIRVEMMGGAPKLVAQRGDRLVERISPQIRESMLTSSIPAIPLENIDSSFTTNRIVPKEIFDAAPYILTTLGNNLIIGTGDEVYARGNWPSDANSLEIYRQINSYEDPDTDESLGVELRTLGFATIVEVGDDGVRKLLINSSNSEIQVGDHLLVREQTRLDPTIFPTEPAGQISGRILALTNGERLASLLDSVVINLGARDGLTEGDILSIQQVGERLIDSKGRSRKKFSEKMKDFFTRNKVQMPNKEIGTLLVYKTFEKLSYGLILTITEPTGINDIVTNP